jgi:DNA-binding beta-propeller fold protein YncE
VADSGRDRIQVFSSKGKYLSSFGSTGTLESQFDRPAGVTIDNNGNVFVADRDNRRVQKFDKNGTFLLMFGAGVATGAVAPEICTSGCLIGLPTTIGGGFSVVDAVAIGLNQRVYATDQINDRMQIFTNGGSFVKTFGAVGDGALDNPIAIAIDQADEVYVVDANNYRIVKYSATGAFLRTWGWGVKNGNNTFQVCTSGCLPGIGGVGAGQFHAPSGLTVDTQRSFVYVADFLDNELEVFTLQGDYLGRWGTSGSTPGELGSPRSLDFDSRGYLYLTEDANNRVQKFRYPMSRFVADSAPSVPAARMNRHLSDW